MRNDDDTARSQHRAGTVQSVDRAATILNLLARDGSLSVNELAGELGVHKSTASRLVSTLEHHDLVEQTDARGSVRLGVGVVRLAATTSARLDLVQEARPVARLLARETGETVNITVLGQQAAVYVDQVVAQGVTPNYNWVGRHTPLHATSNGKVLLSELPDGELGDVVGELTAYTSRTITDLHRLRAQLAQVRERGWSVARDELDVGLTAVAAPVRDLHGEICGSVSVSGQTFRIDAARVRALAPLVLQAANDISARMGWQPRPGTMAAHRR